MMSKAKLEKKYGISIIENGYYNNHGRYVKLYDIYSADGCRWDAGFHTLKGVAEECAQWQDSLLSIKRNEENLRRA